MTTTKDDVDPGDAGPDTPSEAKVPALRATVVALFPELVTGPASASILGRAQTAGTLVVEGVQLRDFATDKHQNVDDKPAGGGPGMVLKVDVLAPAIEHAKQKANAARSKQRVLLLDAAGQTFSQADARRLATYEHLVFVCGRYEGVDARVHAYVDEVVSIGDFVLTGGELAAGIVLDAVARHVPGVLGNEASSEVESHERPRLEHRQFTRPVVYEGKRAPTVLFGGNHALVDKARKKDGLVRTQAVRPDLLERAPLEKEEEKILRDDRIPSLDPVAATPPDGDGDLP